MKKWDLKKDDNGWKTTVRKGKTVRGTRAANKEAAKRHMAAAARKQSKPSEPISVDIHDQHGKFQEERTYPRSADPKKSKG